MIAPHFDGRTYDAARDHARLTSQLERVRAAMSDGRWYTLHQIACAAGAPEASVSARLRDLRKEKFGGWKVERAYLEEGCWCYRLVETR